MYTSLLLILPIVASSFETLRSYNAHLAVVTQTIPALDEIYGENTRRAMQGQGAALHQHLALPAAGA